MEFRDGKHNAKKIYSTVAGRRIKRKEHIFFLPEEKPSKCLQGSLSRSRLSTVNKARLKKLGRDRTVFKEWEQECQKPAEFDSHDQIIGICRNRPVIQRIRRPTATSTSGGKWRDDTVCRGRCIGLPAQAENILTQSDVKARGNRLGACPAGEPGGEADVRCRPSTVRMTDSQVIRRSRPRY